MTVLAGLGMISYYLVVAVGPGSPLDFPSLCVASTYNNDDANINLMSGNPDSTTDTNEVTGNLRPPEILVSKSVLVKENGGFRFFMFLAVAVFTGFSLFLLLKNRTTIESYKFNRIRPSKYGDHRGGDDTFHRNESGDSIFDLGYKRNWQVVMGTTMIEWLLPIRFTVPKDEDGYVYGDGLSFEVNKVVFNQLKSHNELQQRLSTELGNFRAKQKAIQQQGMQDLISSY
ncbi:unnamed protein product [[Candida] boidinii]|nr:unnamed protein product [[Candida] boidinii]